MTAFTDIPVSAESRGGFLSRFWNALCAASEKYNRRDIIAHFEAMSDEELAKRGIRRENIVSYVYRDLFYT